MVSERSRRVNRPCRAAFSFLLFLALFPAAAVLGQDAPATPGSAPTEVPAPAAPSPDSAKGPPVLRSPPVDSVAKQSLKRADTVLVVKKQFNHREQIIAGGVIMACLVGILAVMNNYNPR